MLCPGRWCDRRAARHDGTPGDGNRQLPVAERSAGVLSRAWSSCRAVRIAGGGPPEPLGPIAVAGDHELMGVVREAIQGRGGQQRTVKEIWPLGEGASSCVPPAGGATKAGSSGGHP